MHSEKTVLQIVPKLPGSLDGVGDYALTLAKALFDENGLRTTFVVAGGTSVESRDGFEVVSGLPTNLMKDATRHFRLPIDRAFVLQGHGTIVTGSVVSGSVRVGDELEWHKGDCFVIPHWQWHGHENASGDEAVLFSINDRPISEALQLYREEVWK